MPTVEPFSSVISERTSPHHYDTEQFDKRCDSMYI